MLVILLVSLLGDSTSLEIGEANTRFFSQAHIQRIKDRRAAKEEKARYEKMAEKMHQKRVERLKRREKRNKLLNS